MDRTFNGQDISWTGHFMDRTFHGQDISGQFMTGQFLDMTLQNWTFRIDEMYYIV